MKDKIGAQNNHHVSLHRMCHQYPYIHPWTNNSVGHLSLKKKGQINIQITSILHIEELPSVGFVHHHHDLSVKSAEYSLAVYQNMSDKPL